MRWWIDGIIRRLGNAGALDNVRADLEARQLMLEAAEAVARRTAPAKGQQPARRRSVA